MFSKPWFRSFDGWWYTHQTVNGQRKKVRLVKGKKEKRAAKDKLEELIRTSAEVVVSGESVVSVLDTFLDWCQKNRSEATYFIYNHHLSSFGRFIGVGLTVSDLKPKQLTAWLDSEDWSDSTKAGAIQTVRTAFRWLTNEGHIRFNPVASARGPSKTRREVILSDDEFNNVLKNSRKDFQTLLQFLRWTGSRPQEAVAIEAKHCQLDQRRIVFPPSQAKGKKHPRVIYLNDKALGIVSELCRKHPHGKILRTSNGQPWDRNKVRCRFRRLKPKVGVQYCAYHLRHTYATEALQRLDPITTASLMGHADASTLARNYQHLAKLPTYMQDAANMFDSFCQQFCSPCVIFIIYGEELEVGECSYFLCCFRLDKDAS